MKITMVEPITLGLIVRVVRPWIAAALASTVRRRPTPRHGDPLCPR